MAAYSIGFADTNRRPWEKRLATVGTDAPGGDLVVQIRISDAGGGLTRFEIEQAIQKLVDFMRESQAPQY